MVIDYGPKNDNGIKLKHNAFGYINHIKPIKYTQLEFDFIKSIGRSVYYLPIDLFNKQNKRINMKHLKFKSTSPLSHSSPTLPPKNLTKISMNIITLYCIIANSPIFMKYKFRLNKILLSKLEDSVSIQIITDHGIAFMNVFKNLDTGIYDTNVMIDKNTVKFTKILTDISEDLVKIMIKFLKIKTKSKYCNKSVTYTFDSNYRFNRITIEDFSIDSHVNN